MGDSRLAEIVSSGVVAVSPMDSVREGLDIMRSRGISCLVVVVEGLPVGIVTERDILWAAVHRGVDFADRKLGGLMTAPVVTASEDTMLAEAYHLLARKGLRHLVMVDAAGRAAGVLTLSDLVERLGCDSLSGVRRVADIMTSDVVTAPGNLPVRDGVRRMAERAISCLIVDRDGRPAGIVTERDVVRLLAQSSPLEGLSLYDVMSCPVVCVEAERPVFEAATLMKKRRMRRLVVVDDDRKTLGVVTQSDIVRGLESRYVRTLKSALAQRDQALEDVGRSLAEQTVLLDNLLRSVEMGIVAVDENWRITYVNPAAAEIFFDSAAMPCGLDIREIHVRQGLEPGMLQRALCTVSPNHSHDFTLNLPRPDGARRYAVRISGIYDKEGVPAGFVLMARDDTERSQAEEHLERLTRNLEQLVIERTSDLTAQACELKEANARLRGMDELKSAFLTSVSHELRTPLTSLLGFSKLVGRDFGRHFLPLAESDAALRKRAGRIIENLRVLSVEGERLARLLNDFLDLSRIESGRMEWRDRVVDLADVTARAVAAVSGLFASRPEVDLEMLLPESSPLVMADPDRLEQVLLNLLGNAAKFTSVGCVTVMLEAPGPRAVRVTVRDTGPGIAPEDRERIFDKFRQVCRDPEGSAPAKGTGLGLAICREIVTHYGGSIWAEPAPGRGASFVFELPTVAAGGVGTSAAPVRSLRREKPLVLVVDDDPAMSSFLIQFLGGEGYRVAAAHDGASALAAAEKLRPDVITMDMAMPGMDGRTAMEALRRDPQLAGIPILVITGRDDAPRGDADAVLAKPLDPDRLLAVIGDVLARRPGN